MLKLSEIFAEARLQMEQIDEPDITVQFSSFKLTQQHDPTAVYCFISLSCLVCIELLPQLGAFNGTNFVLITDGEENDIKEIREELGFQFPIYSYSGPLERVNINKTPTSFVVNEDGEIYEKRFTPQLADITELLNWLESERAKIKI